MKYRFFDDKLFETLVKTDTLTFLKSVKRCMPIGGGKDELYLHVSGADGAFAQKRDGWYCWFAKGRPTVPKGSALFSVLERAAALEKKLSFYNPS